MGRDRVRGRERERRGDESGAALTDALNVWDSWAKSSQGAAPRDQVPKQLSQLKERAVCAHTFMCVCVCACSSMCVHVWEHEDIRSAEEERSREKCFTRGLRSLLSSDDMVWWFSLKPSVYFVSGNGQGCGQRNI